MKFSALAGNGMQRVSSDAAAVLFFLKKRKKRMGAQKGGQPMVAPTFITGSAIEFVGARSTQKRPDRGRSGRGFDQGFTFSSRWPFWPSRRCPRR